VPSSNPHFDGDDDYVESQQVSQRKKNAKAQKKSKKAKRREKEETSLRQERIEAEKERREEREFRLAHQNQNKDIDAGLTNQLPSEGAKKSCNTCGGSFTPTEHRAHFRSDWHRYNQKLKMKGVSPIDENEFLMFDADAFFADDL
jgi:hypothetical protein